MPEPFRIAFIGIDHPHGAGWRESLEVLKGQVEVTALVPRFGGSTFSLEERHATLPRFETVERLVRDGRELFEGAIVCVPNDESPDAIVALAQAGKHVLVEKPGAASAAEGFRMVEAVRQAGVAFQSGYVWRYDPGANRLREMVRDGRFGKLISVEMSFVTSDVSRRGREHYLFDRQVSGRGFFNWLACHWIDLLLYITGEAVVGVTARTGTFGEAPTDVEDGGAAIFELANGTFASFVGGYWLPRWTSESRWTIRGSQRWVHWDPLCAGTSGLITIHGPQPQFQAMEESFSLPADNTPGYGGARSVALLGDWIAQAGGVGPACRNSPESLFAVLELLEKIYESSASGRRMECRVQVV
ncbi:MAG TPA: Gfo/Idh/MocA family oxidoreductase [Planctomycetaceae bacterium]|nr:Gfo/Idh/MocA family oxidoreductase [Planctomycetaceae bacterium]